MKASRILALHHSIQLIGYQQIIAIYIVKQKQRLSGIQIQIEKYSPQFLAHILCQILIYHRAVPVLADNNAERLALAKKCGIYYTFPYDDTLRDNLLRITGGALADAAVYFAFSNKSEPSRVFSLVARRATAIFCARTEKNVTVNLSAAMKNDVTVKCVCDNREYISSAINVLANKAVSYGEFTFTQSPEDKLPEALESYANGDASRLNEEFDIFKFMF